MTTHTIRRASRIAGTGIGVPAKTITNADLSKMVDTNDEWIVTRTGIRERRQIDRESGQTFAKLAQEAATMALGRAGLSAKDLDMVLCSTITPDSRMPGESARIHAALECKKTAGALDLNAACSGFVSGLHCADALIRSGVHKNVLLVGGDLMLSIMDFEDRTTCVLFGDGVAAVVLKEVPEGDPKKSSMILDSQIYCEPDTSENLIVAGGGARSPFDKNGHCKESPYLKMNGKEVFKNGSRGMAEAAVELLKRNGMSGADVDWFVPHQANVRILQKVAELADISMDKVFVNLDRWGNTSAGTIPICLAEMENQGLLKKGQIVILDAFGAGYNYGCSLLRW